jgi:hypothetical protein
MKRLLTVWLTLAFLAIGVGAALACDGEKKSAVKSSTKTSSAVVATSDGKVCTPEMAAACMKAHGATAAVMASCPYHKGATTTAMTASSGSCASKSSATTATTATAKSSGKGVTAYAAGSSCGDHSKGASAGKSAAAAHDCDYCDSWAVCEETIRSAGAHSQIVMLKNGIAFIYTAPTTAGANTVQAAVVQRSERDQILSRTDSKATICPECKSMKQAMASGKLTREVVNIEGGAMAIMTSADPSVVARIHSLVGHYTMEPAVNGKTKS